MDKNMNINNNGQRQPPMTPPAESDMEVKKYLRILRKRKWLILFTALVIFGGWVAYVFLYGSTPVYSATALLQFEDESQFSAVEERHRANNRASAKLLDTNKLLGQIVEEFQWNLSVREENLNKEDVFSHVMVSRNTRSGDYRLVPAGGKYELYFTNEQLDVQDKLLSAFLPEDTVSIYDMTIKVNHSLLKTMDLEKIDFRVVAFEKAIQTLRGSFTYLLDKSQTNLTINASSTSARLSALLANTLAAKFVTVQLENSRATDFREYEVLQQQLEVARVELDEINNRLTTFRERYPYVTVATAGDVPVVNTITSFQGSKAEAGNRIKNVNALLADLGSASGLEEEIANVRPLLAYLVQEGVVTAQAYQDEFNILDPERNRLLRQYSATHSLVIDNTSKFQALIQKVAQSGRQYVSQLNARIQDLEGRIESERQKMRGLPRLERELWDLMMERESKRNLVEKISGRYNDARIKVETLVPEVKIVDEAVPPPLVGRGSLMMQKSIIGLLLGIGLGIGLGVLLEYFDKTVQTSEDLQYRIKLPVLGSIPVIQDGDGVPDNIQDMKGRRDSKLITLDYSPTLESESYRDLRTKILFMNQNQNLSSFLVSSLRPNEGKSLTVSNLAITFAQQKISTLLIDADLRRGVLHNVYGNKKKPGLSDFLISKATLDYENINKLIQKTFIPNLYLITTGSPIPNPTEMLGSERMINLLNVLKSRFGMVVLDTAPFEASSDSAILANHVDGVLLVVRADYTNVDQLSQKIQEYPPIQRNILGLVLNMEKVDPRRQPYQYSYYNY